MNSAAKSEFYRLTRTSGTYIFTAILALMSIGGVGAVAIAQKFFSDDISSNRDDYGTFMDGFTGYSGSMMVKILLVLFVSSMVLRIYTSGSAKQLVSCGIPRRKIIYGQFIGYAIPLSLLTLVLALLKGICNLAYGRMGNFETGHLLLSIAGAIVTVGFLTALAMLFAHLTSNSAATIAACLAVIIGGDTIAFSIYAFSDIEAFYDYWFDQLQANATALEVTFSKQISSIGILAAATAVLVILTSIIFTRKEIK